MVIEILNLIISFSTPIIILVLGFTINKKFEKNKKESEKQATEHQIRYSKLHAEQCEFIKLLFQKLSLVDSLLESFIRIIKEDRPLEERDKENILKPLVNETFELKRYFKGNKILLKKDLSEKIEYTIQQIFESLTKSSLALIIKSKDIYSDAGKHLGIQVNRLSEMTIEDKSEFNKTMEHIEQIRKNNLKDSLNQLEYDFRNIFGIE